MCLPSACWDTHPPPVNRITDTCENINLATTTLRTVTTTTIITTQFYLGAQIVVLEVNRNLYKTISGENVLGNVPVMYDMYRSRK